MCICINCVMCVCVCLWGGSELEMWRLDNWLLLIKSKLCFEGKGGVGDQVVFRTKEWLLLTLWYAVEMLIKFCCFKVLQVMEEEPSRICMTSRFTAFKCHIGPRTISKSNFKVKKTPAQRKTVNAGILRVLQSHCVNVCWTCRFPIWGVALLAVIIIYN